MHDAVQSADSGWITRKRTRAFVLVVATALAIYLCFLLVWPFFSALAWALALAVLAYPAHRYVARAIGNRDIAAVVTCVLIAVVVVLPAWFVTTQIATQASAAVAMVKEQTADAAVREAIEQNRRIAPALEWLKQNVDLKSEIENAAKQVTSRATQFVSASVWIVIEMLITFFVLFYFLRDRDWALQQLNSFSPLTGEETKRLEKRVVETIHGTVYGSLVVALVQGALGASIFWLLGLPAPLLWGGIMALLAVIPVLGTYIVWVPAAIYLALSGDWGKATILVGGGILITFVDNLLYPILVGSKIRLHALPVFFSFIGGLIVFGASGLILGPLVLAITVALLDVWRSRTRGGHSVEAAVSER